MLRRFFGNLGPGLLEGKAPVYLRIVVKDANGATIEDFVLWSGTGNVQNPAAYNANGLYDRPGVYANTTVGELLANSSGIPLGNVNIEVFKDGTWIPANIQAVPTKFNLEEYQRYQGENNPVQTQKIGMESGKPTLFCKWFRRADSVFSF